MSALYQAFLETCRRSTNDVAVVQTRRDGDVYTTFGELEARARAMGHWLADRVESGAILPQYASRSRDAIALMLGGLAAGVGFSFVNRKAQTPQLAKVCRDLASSTLVADPAALVGLRARVAEDDELSSVRWWLLPPVSEEKAIERAVSRMAEQLRIEQLCIDPESEFESRTARKPGAATESLACLFTSGSTGVSKGVLITEADLVRRAQAEIDCFGLKPGDAILNLLPWSFDVGLNQLLTMLVGGTKLVILDSWLPADVKAGVNRHAVSGMSGVPSLWRELLQTDLRLECESLRYVTVSGGSLTEEEVKTLRPRVAPAGIIKTYGQTEAFRATCLTTTESLERPGSVGRPFPGVRVYVVDEELRELGPETVGQVVHSGLGVMLGYVAGESNGKLIDNPFQWDADDADKAVLTGDYGYFDRDGYLYLKGRMDDMVKIKGNRVYPEEVARQARTLQGVGDAVVVALTMDGESKLVGFVKGGANAVIEEMTLRRELAQRVPSYMVPERIGLIDHIPLTESGKPDLSRLRDHAKVLLDGTAKRPVTNTRVPSVTGGMGPASTT